MNTNSQPSGYERDRRYVILSDYADRRGVQHAYQALSILGADHELMVSLVVRYLAESGPRGREQSDDESVFAYAAEHGHIRVVLRWRGSWRGLAFCSVEPDETEVWHRRFTDAERWLTQRAMLSQVEEIMKSHYGD